MQALKLPRWMTKTKFAILQQMDPDEAEEQMTAWRLEYNSKRREKVRADADRINERRRTYSKKNPKKLRQYKRTFMAKVYADPERHAEYKRKNAEKRRRLGLDKNRVYDPVKQREKDRRKRQRIKTQLMAQRDPMALRKLIRERIPKYLTAPSQMDIISAVMTLALDRKIPFDDLAVWIKKCVSEHNRQFDYFKTVSIDAPVAGTEDLKLIDLIAAE